MPSGYLVLASERCVLSVMLNDDAIQQTIGRSTIEHDTTFVTEDQLLINGDELGDLVEFRFYVPGVPFPIIGYALLTGTNETDGSIADRPTMMIDEFRSMISFATRAEVGRPIAVADTDGE